MRINSNSKIDSDKLEKFVNSDPILGKFWKDRIERLIDVRDRLIDESDFTFGELIIDRRNGEIGLVIGPFDPQIDGSHKSKPNPSDDSNTDDVFEILTSLLDTTPTRKISRNGKVVPQQKDPNQYYLVVTHGDKVDSAYDLTMKKRKGGSSPTLTKDIDDLPKLEDYKGCRVRYVKRKYIQKLDILFDNTSLGDLKDFCHNQCIMDCSNECILHKFGCYPKDSN